MTQPTADQLVVCCGRVPASTKGRPVGLVCMLCTSSPNYWRHELGARARLAAAADRYARTGSHLPGDR